RVGHSGHPHLRRKWRRRWSAETARRNMTPTDQFHRYLHEHCDGKVRLELDVLLRAFQQVHPEQAVTPSARAKLRELLDRLQLDERINCRRAASIGMSRRSRRCRAG